MSIYEPDKLLVLMNVKPKEKEKKENGEVFTPLYLVNEMLDQLDHAYTEEHGKSIFSEPHLKWFDPAAGIGNFPFVVYQRLMNGLNGDEEDRRKHILEQMIYAAELTPQNVSMYKTIFDGDKYKLHIYEGDSLKMDLQRFDVVLGNPPYNKSKNGTLKGGYGGRSLWDLFVVKSLNEWVDDGKYLLFIHPPSWRKPEHYLWDILGKKQILYLKTYSEKEGKEIFSCSTRTDYYVLKNTNIYKKTIMDGQDGKRYSIDLNEWNFLPSGALDTISQLFGNNEVLYSSSIYDTRRPYVTKNEVLYSRTIYGTDKKNMTKTESEKNSLPVVHNMTKKYGLGFVYSSEDKGHFGVAKVILSFGQFQYPYNDWKGEYGMSQICYGLKINSKEEGDKIVEAINSPKFKEILKYTKWSTFQTDWRMFKYFKKDFYSLF